MNLVLPGGVSGDGYKVYLLSKLKNVKKMQSLKIIFFERVNGMYALTFLGLILFLYSDFKNVLPYSYTILVISCSILITPIYLLFAKYLLSDHNAVKNMSYSFIVQVLQLIMIICVIYALRNITYIIDFMLLFIVASIIAIIPITIGGIGLREITFMYGAQLLDKSLEETGVAIALFSFFIYVVTVLPGMFFSKNHLNL